MLTRDYIEECIYLLKELKCEDISSSSFHIEKLENIYIVGRWYIYNLQNREKIRVQLLELIRDAKQRQSGGSRFLTYEGAHYFYYRSLNQEKPLYIYPKNYVYIDVSALDADLEDECLFMGLYME